MFNKSPYFPNTNRRTIKNMQPKKNKRTNCGKYKTNYKLILNKDNIFSAQETENAEQEKILRLKQDITSLSEIPINSIYI